MTTPDPIPTGASPEEPQLEESQRAASSSPANAIPESAASPVAVKENGKQRRGWLRVLLGRGRQAVGGAVDSASRGAKQLLTPIPEEPVTPIPPVVVNHQSKLLNYSPFAIGFFGSLGVILALALTTAIIQVQHVLVLVVLSLFLALGLNPAVEFFTRRRVPRPLAVFGVTITVLGVIVGGVTALVPLFTAQVETLTRRTPFWLMGLTTNPQIAAWNDQYRIIERTQQLFTSGELVQTAFGGIWGAGVLVANLIFSLIMTLVLTIYFLASLPAIKETIYRLAPASRRARSRYLAEEIFNGISSYITGMFMIVTVASVCAFIYMNIAGLGAYSLALAFVVALFCFIPLVGSSLAMITVALVGFATSPSIGIATIIYFLLYQQFDAYVLYPTVMKRTVKVPGALVVLSALIGGILLGVIGALIAIPTAAAILLLYREVVLPHLDAS